LRLYQRALKGDRLPQLLFGVDHDLVQDYVRRGLDVGRETKGPVTLRSVTTPTTSKLWAKRRYGYHALMDRARHWRRQTGGGRNGGPGTV